MSEENNYYEYIPCEKTLSLLGKIVGKHRVAMFKCLDQLDAELMKELSEDEYDRTMNLTANYYNNVGELMYNYQHMFFSFLCGKDLTPYLWEYEEKNKKRNSL